MLIGRFGVRLWAAVNNLPFTKTDRLCLLLAFLSVYLSGFYCIPSLTCIPSLFKYFSFFLMGLCLHALNYARVANIEINTTTETFSFRAGQYQYHDAIK